MLKNIDSNKIKFYVIFLILLFNFIWLSELRFILDEFYNRVVRYTVYITFLGVYFYFSKINYKNYILIFSFLLLFFSILFINYYHNDFTLFSIAFFAYPFLILLFNSNTEIEKSINQNKLLVIFNILVLFYAIYAAYLNLNNKLYLFNHNEISSFSFFISIFSIILSELKKKLVNLEIFTNLFITLILPLIIVHFNCLVRSIHFNILRLFNSKNNVISADSDRYDMYLYVKYIIDKNIFGMGFSDQEYLSEIIISGLHSGTLNLMYWGGYYFYITFMLAFITIILYSYHKNKLFISGIILTYYLLLLNYYEGFLFGNMGLLILYIYMIMCYFNYKKEMA